MKTQGERLRCAREKSGLSLKQVHRLTGISEEKIESLENEKEILDEKQIMFFSDLYGVSLTWLKNGEPDTSHVAYLSRNQDKFKSSDVRKINAILEMCSK